MYRLHSLAGLLALACVGTAFADDLPEFDGGDVVVSASGVPQAAGVAPVSVTVIRRSDIAASSAQTVQDLLATTAGVHLIKSGGVSGSIDLRGFGMTASSNTLILVDGVRQNTNDQAAPDLGYLPLSSIERIEIVRGSGAVQYGDGATGGVINIITRTGSTQPTSATLSQTVGSYRLRETDLNFNVSGDRVSIDGYGQSKNTDHYRQNGAERRDGGGLGMTWRLDDGSVRFYVRSSSDSYGMSGVRRVDPATGVDQYHGDPAGATTPTDHGTVKTELAGLSFNHGLGSGRLFVDLSTRDKTTSTLTYGYSRDERQLNEDAGSIRYVQPFAGGNQWLAGFDWLYGDAGISNNTYSYTPGIPVRTVASSKQRHQGWFGEAQVGLWSGARMTLGGRVQRVDDYMRCTGVATDCYDGKNDHELHAWQAGLRQALAAGWSAYGKIGRSFRLPNSDEWYYAQVNLQPQTSQDRELGLEWNGQGTAMFRLAAFRNDVDNEIHYVPFVYMSGGFPGGYSINLPPTRHEGIELEARAPLGAAWSLYGNLTWQKATFLSGVYGGAALDGHNVPLVPSWMANIGLSWAASERTRVNLEAEYVGQQNMDNDQRGLSPYKLSGYTLVNMKLTQQFSKSLSGSLAVNNLFDRLYASYGVISTNTSSNAYNVYPADRRNVAATLTLSF